MLDELLHNNPFEMIRDQLSRRTILPFFGSLKYSKLIPSTLIRSRPALECVGRHVPITFCLFFHSFQCFSKIDIGKNLYSHKQMNTHFRGRPCLRAIVACFTIVHAISWYPINPIQKQKTRTHKTHTEKENMYHTIIKSTNNIFFVFFSIQVGFQ
jgi:hypothetical protein